ncbi:MAG: class V aminotransferase [Hyphomonadaceae bacterium]|nr:class V aminotransferase [Hyphomonadaceae bacterium]
MSWKRLFSCALAADTDRLHVAAHSHHLWPDAAREGHMRAFDDAARLADLKWPHIFETVYPEACAHIARELELPRADTIAVSSNTHDFLLRIVSAWPQRRVRILSTDGEFHSFRRQTARWAEDGDITVERVSLEPFETFADRFAKRACSGEHDIIFVSQVFFRTGRAFDQAFDLAEIARPEGPWVVIDGYHGFMALPTKLSAVADSVFYLAGGYKYAMAGEGMCFLHAPAGFAPRPAITGWFAEFGALAGAPGAVGYGEDGSRFLGATFDASALYRFNAVREMLEVEGLDTATIHDHAVARMADLEYAIDEGAAGRLGEAEILNPSGRGRRARFLALRHPEARAWQATLERQNVIADARDDVLRIGFALYHDAEDVAALCAVCRRSL